MAAPRKSPLRAVSPDEKPAPKMSARAKTVTQAATGGTTRELLVAMRDRTAVAVEDPNTPARDLAALTKRLMEIVREIEALDARTAEEAKDDAAEVEDGEFDASAV
jgi:hypothetical protein